MSSSQSALAQITRRIALARERLERQRELVQMLAKNGGEIDAAEALFGSMRQTLENLEEDRRQIEDELHEAKAERR